MPMAIGASKIAAAALLINGVKIIAPIKIVASVAVGGMGSHRPTAMFANAENFIGRIAFADRFR